MMGRKRGNKEKVNLYICKRNTEHFRKRLLYTEGIIEVFAKYKTEYEALHEPYIHLFSDGTSEGLRYVEAANRIENTINSNYHTIQLKTYPINQQAILEAVLSNTFLGNYMKKFCYSADGVLDYNSFSIDRISDLSNYYKEMVDELEKDENAFVFQQAKWLGIDENIIKNSIIEAEKDLAERNKCKLAESIKELIKDNGEKIPKDKYTEWKVKMKEVLFFYLQDYEGTSTPENLKKSLGQNDRPLKVEQFNFCMEKAELKYEIKELKEKTKEKIYFITQKSSSCHESENPK